MSSSVPEGWAIRNLSSVSDVGSSKRILQSEYVPVGVPFFRSKEAIRRSKKMSIESPLYISRERFEEIKERFGAPTKNEILVTAVGTIGIVYLIEDMEFYFKDGNLLWIRNIDASVNPKYLAKYLASDVFQSAITEISGGSSQSALTIEKLSQLEFNLPPHPEQQKIAAILSSVDEVIEKTQAQIDKLKDLKAGMMQELLSPREGAIVGVDGKPYTEFKSSPLGRIPVGWEVVTLKSVSKRITDGTHQAVKTSSGEKIPFLYVSCIRGGRILWDKASTLTNEMYEIASKGRKPVVGDVLYTAVGSYGHAALVNKSTPFSFQRHIAYVQPDNDGISSEYLVEFLNSSYGKGEADFYAIGNAQLSVTLGDLGRFKLPLPPMSEQLKIVSVLSSINEAVDTKVEKLQSINNVKKALMQDLLTGNVRVTLPSHSCDHGTSASCTSKGGAS